MLWSRRPQVDLEDGVASNYLVPRPRSKSIAVANNNKMYSRSFTTWFMAAMLLLCPFLDRGECCGRCPEHFAAQQSEQGCNSEAASGTACHKSCGKQHAQEPDTAMGESHGPCNHDCPHAEHSDCLCDGAILPNTVSCPDQSAGGWFFVDTIEQSLTDTLSAVLGPTFWESSTSHFPPLISAREMRIHISSFLL